MSGMTPLESMATGITLVAVWLIGSRDIRGQHLMLVAQVLWFVFAILLAHWWLAAQSVVLSGMTVRAIVLWRKESRGAP